MKKIILVVSVISLVSCSKTYRCICSDENKQETITLKEPNDDKAVESCDNELQGSEWIDCTVYGL